jgi:putative membrane protein
MESNFGLVLSGLGQGLPLLLLHFVVTLLLLALGVFCYTRITPFHEEQLVRGGNIAAGIVLGGTIVAFAIPLGATLATSIFLLDIVIWGIIALVLQLAAFGIATLLFRDIRPMIEGGNVAAALTLTGIQIAIGLLNAGAMAG